MNTTDTIREYFDQCDNCEAVMCCSGRSVEMPCGCMGLPTDFKFTEKCDEKHCWRKREKSN